jgi:hypothetical protein
MSEEKKTKEKKRKIPKIFDMLQENNAVDSYIEMFYQASKDTEAPMTEDHKAVMRQYAQDMSAKWDTVLEQMEDSLQNPDVVSELTKAVRKATRIKNPKKKTE